MKQKAKVKKQKNKLVSHRKKTHVFTNIETPGVIFTKNIAKKIIGSVFPNSDFSAQNLAEMLNNVIKFCLNFHPAMEVLTPGKKDTKTLFNDLDKDLRCAAETLHILSHQYEEEAHIYLNTSFDDLLKIETSLKNLRMKIPRAITAVSNSSGKKRGDNISNAKKTLINGLILTYQKLTGKTAKVNFKQPKQHRLDYQGEFYDFASSVFYAISKMSKKSFPAKDIFLIHQDKTPLALGSLIGKALKETCNTTFPV